MHSVELTLDDDTDLRIRDEWAALADAGLPSQARHTGESNRPHITLALSETMTPQVADQLTIAVAELPLPVTIGGLLLFGTKRVVLARLAIPSTALLALQATVMATLSDRADPHDTFAGGRWTPHVTLARRLDPDQVGPALRQLGTITPMHGRLTGARRWDMVNKQERWLG